MKRIPRGLPCGVALMVWVGAPCAAAEPPRAEAVAEAVLLYELAHFADPGETRPRVCLEVVGSTDETDPSPGLLGRAREGADVRARSECTVERSGVVFSESGEEALLLGIGPITWVASDEARVVVRSFRGKASSARPLYRVVLERRRWVCLGPIIEGVPL